MTERWRWQEAHKNATRAGIPDGAAEPLPAPAAGLMPMSTGRLVRAVALLAAALAVAACERATTGEGGVRLRPDDANVLAQGARVYATHCAACHGANLQGQPNWRQRDASGRLPAPPHDATGHTWHHPDEVLFNITKLGVAKAANLKDYDTAMPAFGGVLSDAEIIAVLSWIKAQWPREIRAQQEEVTRAARQAGKGTP